MKGLRALQEIWEQANNWLIDCDCYPNSPTYAKYERKRKVIEKELKALEIIKEKRVNVAQLIKWFSNEYDRVINYDLYLQDRYEEGWFLHLFDNEQSNYILTQKEYDLLKEVLL